MKIAIVFQQDKLPVPDTMGGAVEGLSTILLDENEKTNGAHKLYIIQQQLHGKDAKYQEKKEYKNSEIVLIKTNKFCNFFGRAINKLCKIFKVPSKLYTYVPTYYQNKVLKELKKINPDIIIFEDNIDANLPKYTKHFGKEKLLFHIHTRFRHRPNVYPYMAGIVGVSNFIKNDYEKEYNNGQVGECDYVLNNCVREELFDKKITKEERINLRQNLGLQRNDFVVVYCGRLKKHKGIDKLVEAVLLVPDNIKLLIIGSDNSIKNEKSAFIDNLKMMIAQKPNKIVFTGFVPKEDLYKYYQCADVHIAPTMWEEGAGLVLIEAQLCGLPEIVTRAGGMPEYITSSTIMVEKDDKVVESLTKEITRLSQDEKLLQIMAKEAIEHSKQFKKKDYYDNFIKIVEDLKNKKSK